MSAALKFQGIDELRAALRQLPAELAGEAGHILEAEGNAAGVAIRSGYSAHRVTGNLRDHVSVVHEHSAVAAKTVVKSTARHAHLFEFGTQTRQTRNGANRGAMPPGHVFVPAMVRARRRMFEQLADLLRRAGLQVRGGG